MRSREAVRRDSVEWRIERAWTRAACVWKEPGVFWAMGFGFGFWVWDVRCRMAGAVIM